jgi:hypothetical protein
MDLKNKLKDLPPIYLLTLDERKDRQEYTEIQYDYWGIRNYKKISGSNYQLINYEEWKDIVTINEISDSYKKKSHHIVEISISLFYLITIKNWLETTNDPYLLLMEDDYDLSLIEYWHFDWNYLMNNIPYDWDCIQISFENEKSIPCFLHPIHPNHGTGASLINRRYAKKLMDLHYEDGKFDLSKTICNYKWSPIGYGFYKGMGSPNVTGDYFLGHCGRTYCIPLITINKDIGSYAHNVPREKDRLDLNFSRKAYKKWWMTLRDSYTLEEFFTYGKSNDRIITPLEEDLENIKYAD